jgi:hypothetical protein
MSKTMNDILSELNALLELAEEQDGELTDEQLSQLDISNDELEVKLKAYRWRIKEFEATRQLLKDESKRLQERGKGIDGRVDRLKKVMLQAVTLFGNDTKTGTKNLKYDDVTFFTVNKDNLVGDTELFASTIIRILETIFENPAVYAKEIDIYQLVAEVLNEIYEKEITKKFTVNDVVDIITIISANITIKVNILDFITKPYLKDLMIGDTPYTLTPILDNKELISFTKTMEELEKPTIPKIEVVNKPFISSR